MKSLGIASIIRRKKFNHINSKNIDSGKVEPNILDRDFKTTKIDEKWVTDITYLYYGSTRKKAYLSALINLHNNEIVSYKLSTSLEMQFVEDTLREAFSEEKGRDLSKLFIHSDQGFDYTSKIYKETLKENNITQSMSRKGNCHDNACIESFFGHLKSELIYNQFFDSNETLFKAIDEYIHWYNYERFQLVLENHTPIEYRTVA